jgi:Leucine-rich repeat (LRR) protein
MARYTNLKALSLASNLLTSLPPEIGQLTSLEYLSLNYNLLTSLPPEIGELRQLRILNLGNNSLTCFPFQGSKTNSLSNLRVLYLNNNRLTDLSIHHLIHLESLALSNNLLEEQSLSQIVSLVNLRELFLNKNLLASLPPNEIGARLTRLKILGLSGNPIQFLPFETDIDIPGFEKIPSWNPDLRVIL